MEKISINLFGGFKISVGEKDITSVLPHKKMRALVAVLILNMGKPVSHNAIVKELWGDSDAPLTAMRTMMHRLRRAFADYEALEGCIITNRGAYAWNVNAQTYVDVYGFDEHLKKSAGAQIMTRLNELLLAEKIYSGELLPELGSLFNTLRREYRNKYITTVSGITDIYRMMGENEKAGRLIAHAKSLVGAGFISIGEKNGKNAANRIKADESADDYTAFDFAGLTSCDADMLKKIACISSSDKKKFIISLCADVRFSDFESDINKISVNGFYTFKNNEIIMMVNAASFEDALKTAENISTLCGGENVHAQYTVKEL